MATVTTYVQGTRRNAAGDQCVTLYDVGWGGYQQVLRVRGERSRPKIIYLDGDVYLVTTSYLHEFLRKRFGTFVTEVAVAMEIPSRPSGETTLGIETEKGGVEGDETYYFANFEFLKGRAAIDLKDDPPPDLAIEVVHTHAANAAIEVYRRFGVPEVWVWEDASVRILALRPNGEYAEWPTSLSILTLKAAEITEWIGRPEGESELDWVVELRRWAREVLAPRAQGQPPANAAP
jgi:Uma2 family endonuclease